MRGHALVQGGWEPSSELSSFHSPETQPDNTLNFQASQTSIQLRRVAGAGCLSRATRDDFEILFIFEFAISDSSLLVSFLA